MNVAENTTSFPLVYSLGLDLYFGVVFEDMQGLRGQFPEKNNMNEKNRGKVLALSVLGVLQRFRKKFPGEGRSFDAQNASSFHF